MRGFVSLLVMALVVGACASSSPQSSSGTTGALPPNPTVAATSSTQAPEPPAWAIQVFTGRRTTIQTVDSDGAASFSPTEAIAGGDQNNPDWSPDGTQLTFGMSDGSRDDLWIINIDGSDPRKIFDCEGDCDYVDDPAWSPDGASVAVCVMAAVGDEHVGALVSVDVVTAEATTLYTPERKESFCAGPRWSPDGRRIVLELVEREAPTLESDVTGVTLTVIDLSADPVAVLALTDPALFAATADWNRDGDLIVYSALSEKGGDAPDLYTINPDGSGEQRRTYLGDNQGSATEPAFDLDGTTVVFVSDSGLSRLTLSTGEVTAAFVEPAKGQHPRPRPRP